MTSILRTGPAGLLFAGLLGLLCPAAEAADPSVDEMVEALAPKPGPAPRTRSLAGGKSAADAQTEGRLQLQIQFEYNSAEISPAGREVLSRLAAAMKAPALSGRRYRIEGHTDVTGTDPGNVRLSQRRALAVSQFLKSNSGVDPQRVTALGFGSSTLADAKDPRGAINRRVVIVATEAPTAAATGDESAGSIQQLKGTLITRRGNEEKRLAVGARIYEGDVLSTAAGSTALVRLDDGANLLMRSETNVTVTKLRLIGDESKFGQAFQLLAGAFRYVSGALGKNRPDTIAFVTSTATLGLRGTDIDVVHTDQPVAGQDSGTYVRVNSGAVALGGLDGTTVQLAKDEQAYAGKIKPLTRGEKPKPAAMRLDKPIGLFKVDEFDKLLQ
jgi:outer membrane protein OmpA-like peptidoglycan-associated protein